ncbi:MAG: FHA domain-containing protein, partial [Myxococcota bacterium]
MEIRLELYNDERRVLLREIDEPMLLVGSNPECHICVPDDAVASIQCVLRRSGNALYLSNRAAEGTRVGSEQVLEELRLADGDRIALGPIHAQVCFSNASDSSGTRTLAPTARNASPFRLVRLSDGEGWLLDEKGLSVGTAELNDVILVDDYASGRHAWVSIRDGRVMVQDLDSRNGVFVDD